MNSYSRNQMHKNYNLDEQVILNIMHRHIKPIEQQNQIKLILYLHLKRQTSSLKMTQKLSQTKVVFKFT